MEKRDEEVANERVRATTPRRASERACVHPPAPALAGWVSWAGLAGLAGLGLTPLSHPGARARSQEPTGAVGLWEVWPPGWRLAQPAWLALAFYRGLCPAGPMVRTTNLLPRVRSVCGSAAQVASTSLTHPPLDYAALLHRFNVDTIAGAVFNPPAHTNNRRISGPALAGAQPPAPRSRAGQRQAQPQPAPSYPRTRASAACCVAASLRPHPTVVARRKYRIW